MGDGKRFDELSRIWARPMSRRRALRLSAGVLFGGLGTTLLSARPAAAAACTTSADCSFLSHPCCANPTGGTAAGACNSLAPGSVCCPLTSGGSTPCPADRCCQGQCFSVGTTCCGGTTECDTGTGGPTDAVCCGTSCCSAGTTCCGSSCGCGASGTCINNACCPNTRVCGSVCCPPSKVCLNASTGACGCPPGGQTCGNFCCKKGEACSDTAGGCCCPAGSTPCGRACCAGGVACVDRANGICGCQAGTTPCRTDGFLTCCPAGTACRSGCPPPSNNTVAGYCSNVASDRNVKEHVVPVTWT